MTINQITVYNILSWLAFLIKTSYIFELGESAWLKQCAAIKRGNLFFFISISIRLIKIGIGTYQKYGSNIPDRKYVMIFHGRINIVDIKIHSSSLYYMDSNVRKTHQVKWAKRNTTPSFA